jgi:outer membrane protein insertion porin family
MRRLSLLGLLWAVAPLTPWGGIPLFAQTGLEEVTEIRFEGNQAFPDEVLATAILTRETECRSIVLVPFCWAGSAFALDPYFLSSRELRSDRARIFLYYASRGYREAAVDTIMDRSLEGEVRITFEIQEGEPILVQSMEFQGLDELLEELGDSSVVKNVPLRVGDPLSLIALDATRDTLEIRLKNLGYAHVDVFRYYMIPRDPPHQANVELTVDPGPLTRFGPITVEWKPALGASNVPGSSGGPTVREDVIRRMLPFREGDVSSEKLRFSGQRNLYNLDLFSSVTILPDSLPTADSILPLTLTVAPGLARRVRIGGGFSTAECLSAEARWASNNFFGGARRLQISGRMSNVLASYLEPTPLCRQVGRGEYGRLDWLVSADFTQPWVFSPRNSASASLFWERQSLKDSFVRESQGLTLGLTRTLTASTPLTISYRPQFSRLTAAEIFFCSNYLICDPDDAEILREGSWLSPIGVSWAQDRRNQPLSPTRGHTALVDLEYAAGWTGSEFPYFRVISEGTWYTQRGSRQGRPRWVFGAHLRGGWVRPGSFRGLGQTDGSDEIVHPEKRLYGGGSNSVRGFAQNRLGPQVLNLREVEDVLSTPPGSPDPPPCTPEEIVDGSCDAGPLEDGIFLPGPTGGTALLEGSMEVRFPVAGPRWEGAAFLDFGEVWGEQDQVRLADLKWTPGFGIRYFSPIGPIRVDLAYRFSSGEELQVVTSQVRPFDALVDDEKDKLKGPGGEDLNWVESEDLVRLTPRVLWGDLSPWSFRRFQLHLSIGQAF